MRGGGEGKGEREALLRGPCSALGFLPPASLLSPLPPSLQARILMLPPTPLPPTPLPPTPSVQ